jgi:hypothetical protein
MVLAFSFEVDIQHKTCQTLFSGLIWGYCAPIAAKGSAEENDCRG